MAATAKSRRDAKGGSGNPVRESDGIGDKGDDDVDVRVEAVDGGGPARVSAAEKMNFCE